MYTSTAGSRNCKLPSIFEFLQQFPSERACREHIFRTRFDGKPCPKCDKLTKWYPIYEGKKFGHPCGKQISTTGGTLASSSNLPLRLWFYAMLLFSNSSQGITAHFLQRHFGIAQAHAWRMCDRIRTHIAMLDPPSLLGGPGQRVHVDETLIRGVRTPGVRGAGRAILFGIATADKARSIIVPNRARHVLLPLIRRHVHPESQLTTDSYSTYRRMSDYGWKQAIVNHSKGWANEEGIHQVPIEAYWSAMKRSVLSSHQHVGRDFLWKYVRVHEFRYNRRRAPETIFRDMISSFPSFKPDNLKKIRFVWDEAARRKELLGRRSSRDDLAIELPPRIVVGSP